MKKNLELVYQLKEGKKKVNNERVILVDDSPEFVEALKRILKLDNIGIKVFTKPEEFLVYSEIEMFNKCEILIVDYSMPIYTGFEVYKQLYEKMSGNIPIELILYTANTEQINSEEKTFFEKIGVQIIKKPNIQTLLEKITKRVK